MPGLGRTALALLCRAQFVDVLDVNVVLVALPSIGADLGLAEHQLQWVVTAYVLPFAGCLLLAGRLADVFGRRRLFMTGLALFTAASLVCGLAGSASVLLAGRAVQGMGASLTAPAALALITTLTRPGRDRDRAIALWTAVAAAGGAAGLVLGGIVTDTVGWPWIFYLNVPVGVAVLVLARRVLPESTDERAPRRLDVPGALTITAGLVALVFGLSQFEEPGGGVLVGGLCAVAGLALLVAFVMIERRAAHPLMPPGLLVGPLRSAALVGAALTAVTTPGAVICTLFLQDVRGLSAATAGLAALPLSGAVVLGSVTGGRVAERVGARRLATAGLCLVAAGCVVVSTMTPSSGLGLVVAWGVLAGLGLGVASVAATGAGAGSAPAERRGVASGLLNTAAQAGTGLGLAVLLSLAAAGAGAGDSPEAVVDGYRIALLAGAVISAVAVLAARRLDAAR